MNVKIHEILSNADGIDVLFDANETWLRSTLGDLLAESEEGIAAPGAKVSLHFQMINGSDILVRGKVAGQLSQACSRCLATTPQDLQFGFDVLFCPRRKEPKAAKGAEIMLHAEDLDVDFFDGDILAVDHIVEEQLRLALPDYPLCEEECRGLCGQCGKNLNDGSCACVKEEDLDSNQSPFVQLSHKGKKD